MSEKPRTSLLYDPKARSLFFQAIVAFAIIFALYLGIRNLVENYPGFSFDFMGQPSPVQVLTTFGTWAFGYEANASSVFTAFLVAVSNTLILAFIGIIFATIWGFILGVFRLSSNFILRAFSTVYIEILRNVPLLLQIFLWIAVTRSFSDSFKVADSLTIIPGVLYYNASGLRGPFLDWQQGGGVVFLALIAGALLWWLIARWAKARQAASGKQFPVFWAGLGLFILVPVVAFYVMGKPVIVELPTEVMEGPLLKRGAFEIGVGAAVVPQFIALFLALSTYTAAFIAEIVRAGILAVPKGQTEASQALGLPSGIALRKVILPQALRVIIPPLTSQYLNLTKNSSLAAAIGYPETVMLFTGITLNQTGKAVEIILITIGVYLTISLITAAFMNWFNARMKLVER